MSVLKIVLVIMFLTLLVAGGSVGMVYLDEHIKTLVSKQKPDGSLHLIAAPPWLNQELEDMLVKTAGGRRFPLNDSSAQMVAERLSRFSWLDNVRVQTTPDYINVTAEYRRPLGMVKGNRERKVYLDSQMRVLDYLPLTAIPIPEIKGLSSLQIRKPD